jgi:hypothetical protein
MNRRHRAFSGFGWCWLTRRFERRDQRGVAMVEFAILLPVLATIVFGTVDLGRAYTTYEHMKNAAREGAYLAAVQPYAQFDDGSGTCPNPGDIWDRALQEANSSATDFNLSVTVGATSYASAAGGTQGSLQCNSTTAGKTTISVKVTDNNFKLITPFISAITGPIHISSTVKVQGAG